MKQKIYQKAHEFARKAHEGQLYDGGEPFIRHPERTAELIKIVAPNDDNLIASAYLHDVVEDTDITEQEVRDIFGDDITDLVMEVTKVGSGDKKYFPRLKTQRGIMLKFADRTTNVSSMGGWDKEKQQKYLDKSKFWKSEA